VSEQLDLLADLMPMAARQLGDTSSLSVLAAVLRHVRERDAEQTGEPEA
jgi:hypothetical protein